MEKNKNLEQVLKYLPKTTITYHQKQSSAMNIPYILKVKDYKKLYLNEQEIGTLTQAEQLILLNSNNSDPTYTPSTTLAGIFKAREIMKRSENSTDAIKKCNSVLVDLNKASFQKRSSIANVISQKRVHANLLEYYLKMEEKMKEYEISQQSFLAPLRNLKNKILETITKKPYTAPPCTEDELERGRKEWEKFREEQKATDSISNEKLLKRYKYNSDYSNGEPFSFLYNSPELSALDEEYTTTNIALQILDGSAYKKAENALNRNPHQYIKKVKALGKQTKKER